MGYIPKIKQKPTFSDIVGRWSSFPEFYKKIPGADTYKADKAIIIRDYLKQFWAGELPLSKKKVFKSLPFGGKERCSVECCSEEALALLEKKLFQLDDSKHKPIKNSSLPTEEGMKRKFSAKRLKSFSEDMGVEVDLVIDLMIENFSEISAFLPDSVKVLAAGMVDEIHEFVKENEEVDIEPSFIVINENHLRAIRDSGKCTLHSLRIEDFQRFSYIEEAIEDKFFACPIVSNFVKFCEPVTLTQDNLYVTVSDEHDLKKAIVDIPKIEVKSEAANSSYKKINPKKEATLMKIIYALIIEKSNGEELIENFRAERSQKIAGVIKKIQSRTGIKDPSTIRGVLKELPKYHDEIKSETWGNKGKSS